MLKAHPPFFIKTTKFTQPNSTRTLSASGFLSAAHHSWSVWRLQLTQQHKFNTTSSRTLPPPYHFPLAFSISRVHDPLRFLCHCHRLWGVINSHQHHAGNVGHKRGLASVEAPEGTQLHHKHTHTHGQGNVSEVCCVCTRVTPAAQIQIRLEMNVFFGWKKTKTGQSFWHERWRRAELKTKSLKFNHSWKKKKKSTNHGRMDDGYLF